MHLGATHETGELHIRGVRVGAAIVFPERDKGPVKCVLCQDPGLKIEIESSASLGRWVCGSTSLSESVLRPRRARGVARDLPNKALTTRPSLFQHIVRSKARCRALRVWVLTTNTNVTARASNESARVRSSR